MFKGFIQAQKDAWKDLKAVWKPALALDLFVAIVSWITGWEFNVVLLWTMGIITGIVAIMGLWTVVVHLWRNRGK